MLCCTRIRSALLFRAAGAHVSQKPDSPGTALARSCAPARNEPLTATLLSRIPVEEPVCSSYQAGVPVCLLPCGGCGYCTKIHNQWQRFEDEVDDVVPLVIRLVGLPHLWGSRQEHNCFPVDSEEWRQQDLDCSSLKSEECRQQGQNCLPVDSRKEVEEVFHVTQVDLLSNSEPLHLDTLFQGVEQRDDTGGTFLPRYTNEEIKGLQLADPDLQPLFGWLGSDEEKPHMLALRSPVTKHLWLNKSQLVIKNGVLYYKWLSVGDQESLKLLIPQKLKQEVLRMCHDSLFGGHMGRERTLWKMKISFFWPTMSRDCELYVSSCGICSRNKKSNRRPRAALSSYHVGAPLERVHLDVMGPLVRSEKGNKLILLIVDQFTKWVEICPIPEQSAETTVKNFFESFICRFGVPLQVHTDQGRNFDGNLFKAFCDLMQATKTRTTPYHPSANGQVERYNRTILQMIRCFLKNKQQDWDKYLPAIGMALRATVNGSTGYTANMMMLGREVQLPIDVILGTAEVNLKKLVAPVGGSWCKYCTRRIR